MIRKKCDKCLKSKEFSVVVNIVEVTLGKGKKMNMQFVSLKVICDLDKWDFCGVEGTDLQLKWVDERMGCEEMKAVKINNT